MCISELLHRGIRISRNKYLDAKYTSTRWRVELVSGVLQIPTKSIRIFRLVEKVRISITSMI